MMRTIRTIAGLTLALATLSAAANSGGAAHAATNGVGVREVTTVFEPVYVASPPGDRDGLFVAQKEGVIRVVRNGELRPRPFLDISSEVLDDGLRGLLSMAFAPDYAKSR